jgi:hypothetical protein
MTENQQFGPWATMFETGPRARLSTFWKRRMAMLPSTASAEKTLARRVRFLLLFAACAAISAPTVYLLRAPQVRAHEPTPTPAASAVPVDVPMAEPTPVNSNELRREPTGLETVGPIPGDEGVARIPESKVVLDHPSGTPVLEERVVQEQREVDGKIETVERRFQVAVSPAAVAPKAPHKVEFLPARSALEEKILLALAEPTVVEFEITPLHDVIDYLQEKHHLEIEIDGGALNDVDISLDMPITLKSKGLPLRSTLRRLLPRELTYYVDDDVLMITTQEKASETLVTRTYPVGDLVSNTVEVLPAEPAAPIDPNTGAKAPNGGGMGGGVGGRRPSASRVPSSYSRLIEAMTNTIQPESWGEAGGSGSIVAVPEARSLVISQTHAAHDDVVRLLRALRAARAIGEQTARESAPVIYAPTQAPATYQAPRAEPAIILPPTPAAPPALPPSAPSASPTPPGIPSTSPPNSRPQRPSARTAPRAPEGHPVDELRAPVPDLR